MKVIKHLECPKCCKQATLNDYVCPRCFSKFRPKPVKYFSIFLIIAGSCSLSPFIIILGIGLYNMKQWARRWYFIIIIANSMFMFFIISGLNYEPLNKTQALMFLIVLILIHLPFGIYLYSNEQAIEAFEFYGGH